MYRYDAGRVLSGGIGGGGYSQSTPSHAQGGGPFRPPGLLVGPVPGTFKKKKNKGRKNNKGRKKGKRGGGGGHSDDLNAFRRGQPPRVQRLLNDYAGHFLSLVQQEFDDEVREANDKIMQTPVLRLVAEGVTLEHVRVVLQKMHAPVPKDQNGSKDVCELNMRINCPQSKQQLRSGDLCYIRREERQLAELPRAFDVIRSGDYTSNAAHLGCLMGKVDTSGPGFVNISVKCKVPDRYNLQESLMRGEWRIDRVCSMSTYKRVTEAIEEITGPTWRGPMMIREFIVRLLPHSRIPPQAFWDTSAAPPPDPRYHPANYNWGPAFDAHLQPEDVYINSSYNQMDLNPAAHQRLETFLNGQAHLNDSQRRAAHTAARQQLTLIQGPPGTGKTTLSAAFVAAMVQAVQIGQVLVCAFSNVGCDQLMTKLIRLGVRAVRIGDPDKINEELLEHTISTREASHPEAQYLAKLKESLSGSRLASGGTGNKEIGQTTKEIKRLKQKIEDDILASAQVVCCTCVGAGFSMLKDKQFALVLVDECTQSTEPACLIPITKCSQRLILVGDHCQLPPTITVESLKRSGLAISLFERLLDVYNPDNPECAVSEGDPERRARYVNPMGVDPCMLEIQYRMHPLICKWPSSAFYQGRLQNGTDAAHRVPPKGFPWRQWKPTKDGSLAPVSFVKVLQDEDNSGEGHSKSNRAEAEVVFQAVAALVKEGGLSGRDIGIITPYMGQVRTLRSMFGEGRIVKTQEGVREVGWMLSAGPYAGLEIMSVDGYQGREKEVIIFSCVRSNRAGNVGFLADQRRLNVALTRAKRGLIVVGNPMTLASNSRWASWLDFVRMEDLEVQFGSRNNARSYDSGRAHDRSYDGYLAADVRSGYDSRSYDGSCRSSGHSYDHGSYYSDHSGGLLPHPSRYEPSTTPSSSGHPSSSSQHPPKTSTTPSSSSSSAPSSGNGYVTSDFQPLDSKSVSSSTTSQQSVPSDQSHTTSAISQSRTSNSELKDSNSTDGHQSQSYYSDSAVSDPSSQNSATSQTFPSSASSNYLLAPPGMTQTLPSHASVPYSYSYEMQSQYFTPPQAGGYQQYGYASYPPTGNGYYNPYLTATPLPSRMQRKRSRSPSPVRDRKR